MENIYGTIKKKGKTSHNSSFNAQSSSKRLKRRQITSDTILYKPCMEHRSCSIGPSGATEKKGLLAVYKSGFSFTIFSYFL